MVQAQPGTAANAKLAFTPGALRGRGATKLLAIGRRRLKLLGQAQPEDYMRLTAHYIHADCYSTFSPAGAWPTVPVIALDYPIISSGTRLCFRRGLHVAR